LRRQVQVAAGRATKDVFHAGGKLTGSEVNAHTFGLLGTEALYRQSSGDPSFAAFATQQRNWLLGANPWGTSFMIGTGTTFPRCPQHQVSNLRASLTGAPVLTGAVVSGPAKDRRDAPDGAKDLIKGMVACPPESGDELAEFTGHGSRYTDDVRSWETSEPALDMTGTAILGAALQQAAAAAPGRKVSADATTVARGQSTALSVKAGDESTVGALVALTVTGLPNGVTVALAPASVLLGREAKMVILAAPEAPAGKYEIAVSGSASNRTRTAKLSLTVS
jgi:endoglucanase